MAKKVTSEDLTIDYRTIMSMPPSTRRELVATGSVDPLLGVLTPGQRVALFPDYFKQQLNPMAGQRGQFGNVEGSTTVNAASNPAIASAAQQSQPMNNRPAVQVEGVKLSGAREKPGQNSEFYDRAYQAVYKAAVEKGVPNPEVIARLGAAQASIETGYGKHQVGNNYFGIKGKGVTAATQEFRNGQMVGEQAEFRSYGGLEDSAAGYVQFLQENKRYAALFSATSVDQAISIQSSTGYASDPQYGSKLASINSNYGVNAPTATPVYAETPNDVPLADVADDKTPIGGEANSATAVPEAVMRTGGIPYSAAMSAVDRALTANGLHERENKELLKEYLKGGTITDPASQAWCAAFVNASLASAGLKGTGSDVANSFQTYGVGVDDPTQTQKGDIVVRTGGGGPGDLGGHVMMATGNTRINPETGAFEIEIVGGNQSSPEYRGEGAVAVSTRYVDPQGLVVRRATEANLANPPPTGPISDTASQSTGAEPVQTEAAPPAPQTDATATPTEEPSTTGADIAVGAGSLALPVVPGLAGTAAHFADKNTEAAGNSRVGSWINENIPGAAYLDDLAYRASGGYVGTSMSDPRYSWNQPTSSMAAGGVLKEPHTAINNRTGEKVNLGEVGTGGEAIVPMNKVRANEVGQQPYQMPQMTMTQPDQRIPKQAEIQTKESNPKNATGQTPTPSMPIMVDHQVVPPSARKAYADAGLEHRFNNFSSIGTQYRNFGI